MVVLLIGMQIMGYNTRARKKEMNFELNYIWLRKKNIEESLQFAYNGQWSFTFKEIRRLFETLEFSSFAKHHHYCHLNVLFLVTIGLTWTTGPNGLWRNGDRLESNGVSSKLPFSHAKMIYAEIPVRTKSRIYQSSVHENGKIKCSEMHKRNNWKCYRIDAKIYHD